MVSTERYAILRLKPDGESERADLLRALRSMLEFSPSANNGDVYQQIAGHCRHTAIMALSDPWARSIYDAMAHHGVGTKPAWVPDGNSLKQDEARAQALEEMRRDGLIKRFDDCYQSVWPVAREKFEDLPSIDPLEPSSTTVKDFYNK